MTRRRPHRVTLDLSETELASLKKISKASRFSNQDVMRAALFILGGYVELTSQERQGKMFTQEKDSDKFSEYHIVGYKNLKL